MKRLWEWKKKCDVDGRGTLFYAISVCIILIKSRPVREDKESESNNCLTFNEFLIAPMKIYNFCFRVILKIVSLFFVHLNGRLLLCQYCAANLYFSWHQISFGWLFCRTVITFAERFNSPMTTLILCFAKKKV